MALLIRTTAAASLLVALATSSATAAEAPYRLTVVDAGTRDYYCTLTVRLENRAATEVNDVNGNFTLFRGDEAIAEGRSASFVGVAPGGAGEAVFLAPNEPCDEIDGYAFRIGACRIDGSFRDQAECAASFEAAAPIREVTAH